MRVKLNGNELTEAAEGVAVDSANFLQPVSHLFVMYERVRLGKNEAPTFQSGVFCSNLILRRTSEQSSLVIRGLDMHHEQ